ncbi:glycosyltransferase [Thermodesulfobacteriota bacterium]
MQKEKIKIAFIIDEIFGPFAGTEKQIISLIKGIDDNRFEIILCCLYYSEWFAKEFKICRSYELKIKSIFNLRSVVNLFKFVNFLKKEKVHIIQTFFHDSNIIGIISAKLAGVPIVVSSRRNLGYWQSKSNRIQIKILNRFVTKFLANSQSVKQTVHKNEGVDLSRIEVIYNGFDLPLIDYHCEELILNKRKEFGIDSNAIVGGVVANLRPVKRIDVLLRALPLVLKQNPNFLLLVVGEGKERKLLELLSEELNIDDNVKFLGQRSDVLEILQLCHVGILPSSSEGFSNSIIEYLAMGLPVVVTNVGGAQEVVSPENGILVIPDNSLALADGINTIISLENYCKFDKKRIMSKIIRDFNIDLCVNKHERFYENLFSYKL